ncbi:hypothetical protein MUO14_09910 [Halobacillus shinanisalinarum]|uniref:Uncharacterized protein n=1 Tax=Halobacillus shinanisalinarum TaxID=2932258 RepID=A0ABY4H6J1_9BACI|nr:hypothetical protein [Halobacillus shinanisalinarum]UOQ95207.1 hypothetical protein MUO14_09910 [Halobacillus shinanisalinarum]
MRTYRQGFSSKKEVISAVENLGTQAEGIAIGNPTRGEQIIEGVKDSGGTIVTSTGGSN